jgi:hypothetical protein
MSAALAVPEGGVPSFLVEAPQHFLLSHYQHAITATVLWCNIDMVPCTEYIIETNCMIERIFHQH